MPSVPLVRVVRSGLEESIHEGDVAVVDGEGRLVAFAGEPARPVFARSSMKPLQAAVSLSLASFDFPDEEVAVMCASHNAEPIHVQTVRSILRRAGVPEAALRCPAMRPWDEEAAAASPERRPINSDCSGKHGGMLAACIARGWAAETYREPDHPLQRAVLDAVTLATGLDSVPIGVDGCGVPVHGVPLWSMARIYAGLAQPELWGALEPFARRAALAMMAQPYLVAGRNRVDTAVMEEGDGIVVKAGAEALICSSIRDLGLGVAVKIRDGAPRAPGPVLIRVLHMLDALDEGQVERLAFYARPPVFGGGEQVGELVVASFGLSAP